jgi:alginate O-acetyltransferase complex protein AlgI
MSAYTPLDAGSVWGTIALLAATLLAGFAVSRIRSDRLARPAAWAVAGAAVVAAERLNAGEPPGVRMLAIIGALLYAMKGVVAVEAVAQGSPALPAGRWVGFAALWPGMRPGPFARAGVGPRPGAAHLVAGGLARGAAGLALIAFARLAWREAGSRWLATALLLPGLSLVIHFGAFDVLAGAWRRAGVDCTPLFRAPLRSTSLREFWGRRWNLAFSEMTALAVYQPLVGRFGRRSALAASFLGSGVLHELAISVPVRVGFGLPMAYFALHGGLVLAERRLARAGCPVDRVPWSGRAWTLAWVLVPLPVLFHRPFLAGVVWPLIGIHR